MLRNFSEKSGDLKRKSTYKRSKSKLNQLENSKSRVSHLQNSKKTDKSGRESERSTRYSNVLIDYDDGYGDSEIWSEMDFEDLIEQEIDKQQGHSYL